MPSRLIGVLAAFAVAGPWLVAGTARGQEPASPVLLTVESSDGAVDSAAIREALGDALGLPVVAVWQPDAQDATRTINVAFEGEGRRARIRVHRAGMRPRWAAVEAAGDGAKDGTWIVAEIARVLHEIGTAASAGSTERLQGCLDVLDPWRNTVPGPALAPWDASHFAQATPLDREQLNEARRNERADGLTPPRPAPR